MTAQVESAFSRNFASVLESDTLSRCLSLLKKEMPLVLAVWDDRGKYKGVIARRWIVRSRLDPSVTKVKTLMRSAPKVALQDSLSRAAKLMIESGVRQLPVFSSEKILGFVTDEDVIREAVMGKWGNSRVEEIMSKEPVVVEENESVGVVLNLFREQDISHIPVVSNGRLVGIVSIHDIIEHVFQPKQRQKPGERAGEKVRLLNVPAKGIMTKPVITVLPEATLRNALHEMQKFDISSLVIVRRRRPVGIITKLDFLEPIAQIEMRDRRLAVQFSVKDLDIDESQQGSILGDFDSFARRYEGTLEAGTLFIYMKTHGTNYSARQLIHCRLQLRTRKGSFYSSSEGWGVQPTFRVALDRLERQVLRSKEFEYDQDYIRNYLRRTHFPLTEL